MHSVGELLGDVQARLNAMLQRQTGINLETADPDLVLLWDFFDALRRPLEDWHETMISELEGAGAPPRLVRFVVDRVDPSDGAQFCDTREWRQTMGALNRGEHTVILLSGVTGSGKSAIAADALRQWLNWDPPFWWGRSKMPMQIGHRLHWIDAMERQLRECNARSGSRRGLWISAAELSKHFQRDEPLDRYFWVPLLVIDDLGQEPEKLRCKIEEVLQMRHVAGPWCRTIITTNADLNQLAAYDLRTRSRLDEMGEFVRFSRVLRPQQNQLTRPQEYDA